MKGILLTVDIEKAFDSVNYNFLLKITRKVWLYPWLLKVDKYFASKSGILHYSVKMTCHFPLKRGTQGNPILVSLFIHLRNSFIFIKESENVQGMTIFNNQFLYMAYADDTTFFLSNENSVTEVIQIF